MAASVPGLLYLPKYLALNVGKAARFNCVIHSVIIRHRQPCLSAKAALNVGCSTVLKAVPVQFRVISNHKSNKNVPLYSFYV